MVEYEMGEGIRRRMKKQIPTLRAFVSVNNWSYIINGKNNGMRVAFEQFGSCTPRLYLESWLDSLPKEERQKLSKECDERKDIID